MKKCIALIFACLLLIPAIACIKPKQEAEPEPVLTPIPALPTTAPTPYEEILYEDYADEEVTIIINPVLDSDLEEPATTPNTDVSEDVLDATESITPAEHALRTYWVKAKKYNEVTKKNETIYWRVFAITCLDIEQDIKHYNDTHKEKLPLIKSNDIRYWIAYYEVFFPKEYKEPEDGQGIRDGSIRLEVKDENGKDIVYQGLTFKAHEIETDMTYVVHSGSCYRGAIVYPMYIGRHYLFEYSYRTDNSRKELKCYELELPWEGEPRVFEWESDYNWEDYAYLFE